MDLFCTMSNPFAVDDIRKYILTFIVHKRCCECHKPVTDIIQSEPKYYTSLTWRRAQCNKTKDWVVCNWCYHYVWEYK